MGLTNLLTICLFEIAVYRITVELVRNIDK